MSERFRRFSALLAALPIMASLPASAEDCRLKSFGEISVAAVDDGRYAAAAAIDEKPVKLLISLNSLEAQVTHDVASSLNAPVRSNGLLARSGRDSLHDVATFRQLRLGTANFDGLNAYVTDEPLKGADGYVGTNILELFDVEFDLAAGKLRLFGKDHCPGRVVYWAQDYLELPFEKVGTRKTGIEVLIQAKVNDKEIYAALMPELPNTLISPVVAGSMPQDGNTATLGALEFGGIRLRNVKAEIRDTRRPRAAMSPSPGAMTGISDEAKLQQADMKIGADILRKLRFVYVSGDSKIYFTVGG